MLGAPNSEKKDKKSHRKKHDDKHKKHHHRHSSKKSTALTPQLDLSTIESQILSLNDVPDEALLTPTQKPASLPQIESKTPPEIPLSQESPRNTIKEKLGSFGAFLRETVPGLRMLHAFVLSPMAKYHHQASEHYVTRLTQLMAHLNEQLPNIRACPKTTLRFSPRKNSQQEAASTPRVDSPPESKMMLR